MLIAEGVRLIEAPRGGSAGCALARYRTTRWQLARPGRSAVSLPAVRDSQPGAGRAQAAAAASEALLLLEAGCLRAAWEAFRGDTPAALRDPPAIDEADGDEADGEWPAYLCSSLLWHLETKGLVVDDEGRPALAESCSLPPVGTVVRSLVSRHPTMAIEAAGLSRIGDIVHRVVAGDATVHGELESAHWRQLDVVAQQVALLRGAVLARVGAALSAADPTRLLRVLVIGADHAPRLAELFAAYANLEAVITDIETDRLEQAQAALGDDAPRLRCLPWPELDSLPAGSVDLAVAIDALSEVAAISDGLERLRRVLRPQAPLIAGEPAPSVFWDIVRGVRASWWTRSANSGFPVGALLTEPEWLDELTTAGFDSVAGQAVLAEPSIGVVIEALASAGAGTGGPESPRSDAGRYRWEGTPSVLSRTLQTLLQAENGAAPEDPPAASETGATPAVVWVVDAEQCERAPEAYLGETLTALAALCARLVAHPAPLWAIATMGGADGSGSPADHPLWGAVTARPAGGAEQYRWRSAAWAWPMPKRQTLRPSPKSWRRDERGSCSRADSGSCSASTTAHRRRASPTPDSETRCGWRRAPAPAAARWPDGRPRSPAGPGSRDRSGRGRGELPRRDVESRPVAGRGAGGRLCRRPARPGVHGHDQRRRPGIEAWRSATA